MSTFAPAAGSLEPLHGGVSAAPLTALLAAVRRRARLWIWVESLSLAVIVAVAAAWLSLVIDWLVEPPAWVRGGLLVAAVASVAWIVATRLVGRLAVPLSDESLALAIERTHPDCRDGLSTAVACRRGRGDEVDPELVDRTIRDAVALAARVRPAAIFRGGRLAGLAVVAAAVAVGSTAAAASAPTIASAWARRLFLLAEDPWPRRVSLDVAGFPDGVRTVARGSDVDVVVTAQAAGAMPEIVELRTRGAGGWRNDRMGTRGGPTSAGQVFGHVLERVEEDRLVEVRGGDARLRGLRIVVADPPAVADAAISAVLPDYLGGGSRTLVPSRIVQVPRGAAVEIALTATKPLAAATLAVMAAGGEAGSAEQTLTTLPPEAAGTRRIAARLAPIDADTAVVVRLTDTQGLANRDPVAVVLSVVPDERPEVALRLAGVSTAVTPRAVLPLQGTISDDHGLGGAAVRVTAGEADRDFPIIRVRGGEPLVEFPPERPEIVPLADLGLAVGTRLEVVVAARDTCTLAGGPNEGRGDTWTLDVVSPESLRAMLEAREMLLRRRFEATIDDLAKARDVAAAEPPVDEAAARCGDAAARASGETAEIAAEFRAIAREFGTNSLLTPEIEARLLAQIAEPLEAVVGGELAGLVQFCRGGGATDRRELVRIADAALARMRTVLERMLELESVNEVIERLRGVIRVQEQIRQETLERQRKRGREALEAP